MKPLYFVFLFLLLSCNSENSKNIAPSNSALEDSIMSLSSNNEEMVNESLHLLPKELTEQIKNEIQQFIESKEPDKRYSILEKELFSSKVLPRAYTQKLFNPMWLTIRNDSLPKVQQMIDYLNEIEFHGFDKNDYHFIVIEKLYNRIQEAGFYDAAIMDFVHLDIFLSDAFLLLSSHLYNGKHDPQTLKIQYGIQRGKPELELDHKLYKMLTYDELSAFMVCFYPTAYDYIGMVNKAKEFKSKLSEDFEIKLPKNYDFKNINEDSITLSEIQKKIHLLGYVSDSIEDFLNDSIVFQNTVKEFQYYHGLNQDGEIGSLTFEAINTPLKKRLNQLYINIERLRWLHGNENGYRIVVNIADYTLDLIDGSDTLIHMKTIVGKDFRQTPVFESNMTYLVFSPTWTIPSGILRNDVLPAIARDVGYLSKNNMIVIDRSGKRIDPSEINWAKARTGSFPYTIRQQPGDNNALGRVKFMFPNSFSVYLHDTPSKNLFARDERVFSSGCIRVEKPFELAKLLLNDSIHWNEENIRSAMKLTNERTVLLKRPVKIYLYYLTAWGSKHFRKDIYGRDDNKERLFNLN